MAGRILVSLTLWTGAVLIWAASGWMLEMGTPEWWMRLIGTILIVGVILEFWDRVNAIYKKLIPEDER